MIGKTIFPVGLEHGKGDVCGQNGSCFLLNFCNYRFIITALHCIPEKWRNYGIPKLKEYVENNIFFGIIPNCPNIWRIPLCNIFYHKDDLGNFLDILVCMVDEKDITKVCDATSLDEIGQLELSNHNIKTGQYYKIYGFPTQKFSKCEQSYHSTGCEIRGIFTKRNVIRDDSNNTFDIPSSAYPMEVCELDILEDSYGGHGFSGSPVFDEENKVVGVVFRCSKDFHKFYFFPNNILQAILSKIVEQLK